MPRKTDLPRLAPGDTIGVNYLVLAVLGQTRWGWNYRVKDKRCGHEVDVQDKYVQPLKGKAVRGRCNCPQRYRRAGHLGNAASSYMEWAWYGPDGKRVRVFEHTIIMEGILGRPLLPGENVHHKNGVRDDNRPENLELWVTSQPIGQRPEDLVAWAHEILRRYDPPALPLR